VVAFVLRLATLVALILMPIGMGLAPARAAVPAPHSAMGMAAADHCGDEGTEDNGAMAGMHCAGTCSALPDAAPLSAERPLLLRSPLSVAVVSRLSGVSPGPSTPPPRIV
jgi:hypothetical protein